MVNWMIKRLSSRFHARIMRCWILGVNYSILLNYFSRNGLVSENNYHLQKEIDLVVWHDLHAERYCRRKMYIHILIETIKSNF